VKPTDRLREAKKQLTIVADDDDLSEIQQRTAAHLGGLVGALGETLDVLEDAELVADGGFEVDSADEAARILGEVLDSTYPALSDEEVAKVHALEAYLDAEQPDQHSSADQLEIQNAILLELIATVDRSNQIAMGHDPDDYRRGSRLASYIEDNVGHLREGVDLDAVGRWADR
jgi:hypothetical protein